MHVPSELSLPPNCAVWVFCHVHRVGREGHSSLQCAAGPDGLPVSSHGAAPGWTLATHTTQGLQSCDTGSYEVHEQSLLQHRRHLRAHGS